MGFPKRLWKVLWKVQSHRWGGWIAWQCCYLLPGYCVTLWHTEGITFREWGPDLRHHLGFLLCFRKIFGISREAHRGSFPSARHSGFPQGSLPQIGSFQLITNVVCLSLNSLSLQHFRLLGNVSVRGGSSGRRYGQFLFHDARGGGKVHRREQASKTSVHPPHPHQHQGPVTKAFPLFQRYGTCSVAPTCLTLCNPMDCIAHQASLSMDFSRQEYWSGLPFLIQGIFPIQGSNLGLLHLLLWKVSFFFFPPPLRHLGSPQRGRQLWDRIILSESGPSRHCRTCLCFLLMPLTESLMLVCGVSGNCPSSEKISRSSALCLRSSVSGWTRRK